MAILLSVMFKLRCITGKRVALVVHKVNAM